MTIPWDPAADETVQAAGLPSAPFDHGRFAPGAVLASRYRIVGLLGRGGMGEVYRADDLTLGQPVALKFLPIDVDRDPKSLERLMAEVRTARMPHDRAEQLRARLRALDGGAHFYLSNPTMLYPQADAGGTILGSASVVIGSINTNRKAFALSGLPAGYVITMGDYLHVDYGTPSRRALLQAAEGATANGSGVTPEFEVRPHLRPGISSGLAPGQRLRVVARRTDGTERAFEVLVRLDTPVDVEYYRHGGILPFVTRKLVREGSA